jgi:putative transposase
MMAAHAEVYNAALQERRDAWSRKGPDGLGTGIRGAEQMAQLRAVREARPDQAVWSFTSQQQTLRRLDKAFAAFFRRVKAGQLPGYPRFRSAARFDSVDFRHGDGLRLTGLGQTANKPGKREARLYVQGVGHIRV